MPLTIEDIFDFLRKSRSISCGEVLSLGNVVKTVFRATDDSRSFVVKIGLTERTATEVRTNWEGYKEMRSMGADDLLPDYLDYLEYESAPIIIMSDCGPDFWHAVQKQTNPISLYQDLISGMHKIYSKTITPTKNRKYLNTLRSILVRQYETYLFPLVGAAPIQSLREYDLDSFNLPAVCFSSFDFTPEDVFVGSFGVKYVDPIPPLIGVPIIDLACFAGVALDAYELPGSKTGYAIIEAYAIRELPKLLGIDERRTRQLFTFGRSLQCSLSARFRLEKEPHRAKALAEMSKMFLVQFLE